MRLLPALAVAVLLAMPSVPTAAQEAKLEVRGNDTVKTLLERQVGKRVSVVLTTGPELAGVVVSVGDKIVHLSELTGREYFDAMVNLDHIGAVVIRARPR